MTKNLTAGPPTRLIVLFTLPLLVGNLFQQLYQFTDTAVVGRLLGVQSLAAVGATGSLTWLLIGFTFGASGGLAIPTARAYGANNLPQMRRYVAAGVVLSAGIAAVITLIGLTCGRPLLRLLDTPAELIPQGATFLTVTFAGASATMAYNFLAATIRALGDSRTPLYFLILACALNAGLVFVFIAVFHLGVAGAALATIVAQGVTVVLCLALIGRRMPELRLHKEDWHFRPGELGETTKFGLTMGFQMSVIAIGALVLQAAINGLGADAVAAWTVAARVDQVAVQPLASFGLGAVTFVAQNRGALQWKRIRVGIFRTSLVTVGVSWALGAFMIIFGTSICRLFLGAGEDNVVAMSHKYLVLNGSLYTILALLFLLRNAIQGLGVTSVPTIAGFMELALRSVAGLFLVSRFDFFGACLASPAAWLGALLPCAVAWFYERRRLLRNEAGATPKAEVSAVPAAV
ncbi:MAG: MATE family efflux transporter [Propionibacteriaceae bacterium]|jgi:putative MATE family efflux protein|nr:MATE family efflux transporter [Propionibacteriaceae bacterium]